MTKGETARILAILQVNYPDTFKNKDDEFIKTLVNLWHKVLGNNDYKEVCDAILAFISTDTGRFMPTVGIIKNMVNKIKSEEALSELEAWSLVRKAVGNSGYNSVEEFNKLPKNVQKTINDPSILREWSNLDVDEFNTVIQSNFMRSYRAVCSREKEISIIKDTIKLSENVENVKMLEN